MVALGYLFSIVLGTITGVVSAWRRDTAADKAGPWTSLAFYSMPTQWLGLMMVLFFAGPSAADVRDRRPDTRDHRRLDVGHRPSIASAT